jgi:hypothetical protein
LHGLHEEVVDPSLLGICSADTNPIRRAKEYDELLVLGKHGKRVGAEERGGKKGG